MLRSIVLAGGIAAFGALGAAASPLTDKYSSLWVFGDSLSDKGNLFGATGGTQPPAPYFNGRFSNGPVWNESLLTDFAVAGKASGNFAFGGATALTNGDAIPDLGLQTGIFGATIPNAAQGNRALASLWFGANDILDAIREGLDAVAAAEAAADAIGAGVRALAGLGIKDFAVWNLPDIGATPRYLFATNKQLASDAANAFNAQLDIVLADLRDDDALQAAGVQVTEVDTYGLFKDVLKNPGAYGFKNTTTPCIGGPSCDGFLYFDDIHPTTAAHAVLAQTFAAAVPLPGSGVLLAFGLSLLAFRRRAA